MRRGRRKILQRRGEQLNGLSQRSKEARRRKVHHYKRDPFGSDESFK
jgi:hypothetical protein